MVDAGESWHGLRDLDFTHVFPRNRLHLRALFRTKRWCRTREDVENDQLLLGDLLTDVAYLLVINAERAPAGRR